MQANVTCEGVEVHFFQLLKTGFDNSIMYNSCKPQVSVVPSYNV